MIRRRLSWSAGLLLLSIVLGSCGRDEEPRGPSAVALRLFELATIDEPTDAQLLRAFDPLPPVDRRAPLLDALAALRGVSAPRVLELDRPSGTGEAFTDIEVELPGGGSAVFALRLGLRAEEPDPWRVTWFQGPGIEWPAAGSGRGDGLSTSAAPEK